MDISNKKLKKAYKLYESGQLKEALNICEKFLQKESCNEEALEIEGKILKDLGRIEEAILTWKINLEYNDNDDAKQSLAAIDEEKKQQTLSYNNLSQLISEAIKEEEEKSSKQLEAPKLNAPNLTEEKTKEEDTQVEEIVSSDFNKEIESENSKVILEEENIIDEVVKDKEHIISEKENKKEKVSHKIRKEVPTESKIDDTLKEKPDVHIDSREKTPIKKDSSKKPEKKVDREIKITKDDFTNGTNKRSSKKLIYTSAGLIIAAIIVIGGVSMLSLNHKKVSTPQKQAAVEQKAPEAPVKSEQASEAKPQVLTDAEAENVINQLTQLAESNSIDGVNNLLNKYPVDVIPAKYAKDYENAIGFMENQGVNYYYQKGLSAYNSGQYQDAITSFNNAMPYAQKFEAAPTMLFLTASSYSHLNEKEKAMDAYKQYIQEFPNSPYYVEECLYNLAMYYNENNNATQAKQYASELANKYPNSMYNNSNIQEIIKK